MRVKTIVQEEATGCGLACVAMLAGQTYQEVKILANRLGIFAEDRNLWSETHYVRRLLGEYRIGCALAETPFSRWDALPELALLATKYHLEEGRPFWHWAVFSREADGLVVHDPATYLSRNRRTDLDAIAPRWFLEIFPAGAKHLKETL